MDAHSANKSFKKYGIWLEYKKIKDIIIIISIIILIQRQVLLQQHLIVI